MKKIIQPGGCYGTAHNNALKLIISYEQTSYYNFQAPSLCSYIFGLLSGQQDADAIPVSPTISGDTPTTTTKMNNRTKKTSFLSF